MTKNKIQFEYPLHCMSEILYEYLASPEGLSEWFADEVQEKGDDFFFTWDGFTEKATLIRYKPEGFVRYRWEQDEGSKYFFEMLIIVDDLTNDLSLIITDFCESGEEKETQLYWDNLIESLRSKLGAA